MEKNTIFMNRKAGYQKDSHSSQSDLWIKYNSMDYPIGIFGVFFLFISLFLVGT